MTLIRVASISLHEAASKSNNNDDDGDCNTQNNQYKLSTKNFLSNFLNNLSRRVNVDFLSAAHLSIFLVIFIEIN